MKACAVLILASTAAAQFSGSQTITVSGTEVTVGGTNAATFSYGSSTYVVGGTTADSTASAVETSESTSASESTEDEEDAEESGDTDYTTGWDDTSSGGEEEEEEDAGGEEDGGEGGEEEEEAGKDDGAEETAAATATPETYPAGYVSYTNAKTYAYGKGYTGEPTTLTFGAATITLGVAAPSDGGEDGGQAASTGFSNSANATATTTATVGGGSGSGNGGHKSATAIPTGPTSTFSDVGSLPTVHSSFAVQKNQPLALWLAIMAFGVLYAI
ncbi:hypothetical protein GGS20DRAFT_439766 [Poronia punctata]|nr:hypothetical protein GGS20DRAFT_439766 [Poronia punctata]